MREGKPGEIYARLIAESTIVLRRGSQSGVNVTTEL